jgi:hypothetical protein
VDTFRAEDLDADDDLGRHLSCRDAEGELLAFHRTSEGVVQAIVQPRGMPPRLVNLPPGLPVDLDPPRPKRPHPP